MKKLIILCYHGIVRDVEEGFNSSGKHLDLDIFKRQMKYIVKNYEIVTMRDVENFYLGHDTLPNNSVAVTFDDGYANNYKFAHPILMELGVRATLYLATGYIGKSRLMWTDQLELAILRISGDKLKIKLESNSVFDVSSLKNKITTFKAIKKYLKKSHPEKIFETIHEINLNNQVKRIAICEDLHSFLTWEDARFMYQSGIWEIGAHTVDHYSLGVLLSDAGKHQVAESLYEVKKELGLKHTPLFSYPEGQRHDIPKYAVDFLKQIGLNSAPSAIAGKNYISRSFHRNRMSLRRYMVGFESSPFPWKI